MLRNRILYLHKQLHVEPPPEADICAWLLLERAVKETIHAPSIIFEAKVKALVTLIRYGWRDVFKESLNENGEFKSEEEAGRFHFCLQ